MIFDKIKKLLAEQLNVDEETITMESNIVTDLHADSLDVVEMLMAMEGEFDIEVDEEMSNQLVTVKALVEYIEKTSK